MERVACNFQYLSTFSRLNPINSPYFCYKYRCQCNFPYNQSGLFIRWVEIDYNSFLLFLHSCFSFASCFSLSIFLTMFLQLQFFSFIFLQLTQFLINPNSNITNIDIKYRYFRSSNNKMDTFRVYARCRPLNETQINYGASKKAVSIMDGSTICLNDGSAREHMFQLDGVFSQSTNNIEIFNEAVAPIIDNVINGINSTVFAYGITGAGKSFTMFGYVGCNQLSGVIPLTFQYLLKLCESQPDTRIRISYLQIYNEQVFDLFQQTQHNLQLSQDTLQGCVIVQDLRQIQLHSYQQAQQLISMGNSRRVIAETKANQVSSRSHAIVIINMERKVPGMDEIYSSKLSLVDLAGSEKQSVHSQTRGIRTFEGSNINRSLLTLGVCINILSQKKKINPSNLAQQQFIPYRDSKLTRLLKDSLGGNTKTVMIACISPSGLCYEQTANTLKYACRANKIEKVVHQNIKDTKNIEQCKKEITNLKKQNEILKMNLNMSLMMPGLSVGFVEQENKMKKIRVTEALEKLTKTIEERVMSMSRQDSANNVENIQRLIRIQQQLKSAITEQFEIKNSKHSVSNKQSIQIRKNPTKSQKAKGSNYGPKGIQNSFHQRKMTDSITQESNWQGQDPRRVNGKRISALIPTQNKKQNKPNYSQYKIALKQQHRLPYQDQEEQKNKPIINLQNLRKKIMEDKKELSNFKQQIERGILSTGQIKQRAAKILEMGQSSILRLSDDQKDYLMRLVNGVGYAKERFQSFSKKKIDLMNKNNAMLTNQFILNIEENGVEKSTNRHLKSLNRIISLAKVPQKPSYSRIELQNNADHLYNYGHRLPQQSKMSCSAHYAEEQYYEQQDLNLTQNVHDYQNNYHGNKRFSQNCINIQQGEDGLLRDLNYVETLNNSYQNVEQIFDQGGIGGADNKMDTFYQNLNMDEGEYYQSYQQNYDANENQDYPQHYIYENQQQIF